MSILAAAHYRSKYFRSGGTAFLSPLSEESEQLAQFGDVFQYSYVGERGQETFQSALSGLKAPDALNVDAELVLFSEPNSHRQRGGFGFGKSDRGSLQPRMVTRRRKYGGRPNVAGEKNFSEILIRDEIDRQTNIEGRNCKDGQRFLWLLLILGQIIIFFLSGLFYNPELQI